MGSSDNWSKLTQGLVHKKDRADHSQSFVFHKKTEKVLNFPRVFQIRFGPFSRIGKHDVPNHGRHSLVGNLFVFLQTASIGTFSAFRFFVYLVSSMLALLYRRMILVSQLQELFGSGAFR